MRVFVLALLVGCGDPRAATTNSHHDAGAIATPPVPGRVSSTQTLLWDHVVTMPDCFYFSGPDGRDDVLRGPAIVDRNGTRVRVSIGSATFDGSYHEGTLDLMRISKHDFDGPWFVSETMHGTVRDGAMHAHYRYTECELAGECPGRCALTGEVTFKVVR